MGKIEKSRLLALVAAFTLVAAGVSFGWAAQPSRWSKTQKTTFPRKLLTAPSTIKGTVISLTAVEMHFDFDAEFETQLENRDPSTVELAIQTHYQHLLGYFQNRKVVEDFGISFAHSQGMAMPRLPLKLDNIVVEKSDPHKDYSEQVSKISYHAHGRILVHKQAYEKLKQTGVMDVTMPYDLDHYYDENCTSPDYPDFSDFWYFYNPFKSGCRQLNEAPMALPVRLYFKDRGEVSSDVSAGLQELRLAPGKDTFKIYSINGFSDGSTARGDEGRKSFRLINTFLEKKLGFKLVKSTKYKVRPQVTYAKDYDVQGRTIHVVIQRLLADTTIEKLNITFAKFFKEAAEEGDVIIYAGHSGLGGNLDFQSLNDKLREDKTAPIHFSKNKKQIYYLDGCSSYSYYLLPFGKEKEDASRIDILTNGLESLFDKEFFLHSAFYEVLTDFTEIDPSWTRVLQRMEAKMRGQTFLLNVGPL